MWTLRRLPESSAPEAGSQSDVRPVGSAVGLWLVLIALMTACTAVGTVPGVVASDSSWTLLRFGSDEGFSAVAEAGPGFVVVGSSGNAVSGWTSSDGLEWESLQPWEPEDDLLSWTTEVAAAGTGFVAFGATAVPENDGTAAAWTFGDSREGAASPGPPDGFVEDAIPGGPGLVAVGSGRFDGGGSGGAVWTSIDGRRWERAEDTIGVFPPDSRLTSVAALGSGFVAVGEAPIAAGGRRDADELGAAAWTSIDGVDWVRVPDEAAVFEGGRLTSVVAAGPGVVAVGSASIAPNRWGPAIWTSVDGRTWERVGLDDDSFVPGATMIDIAAGGPGLVAIGYVLPPYDSTEPTESEPGPYVWTSPDGLRWTRLPPEPDIFGPGSVVTGVAAKGERVVVVGYVEDRSRLKGAVWFTTELS